MMLQIRIIPQDLISDVLGNLFIYASHSLFLRFCHLIPIFFTFFTLQLFYTFCGSLTGNRLGTSRLLANPTQNIIFIIFISLFLFMIYFIILDTFQLFIPPILFFLKGFYLLLEMDHYVLYLFIIQIIF